MIAFGRTRAGQDVHRLDIAAGDLSASFLTLGAILHDVRLAGVGHSLTLGATSVAEHETRLPYHGAIVGPVANRISGAAASVAGRMHRFEANQDGRHTLHGGAAGTQGRVWEVTEHGPDHVTFAIDLPDGDGGFPGRRRLEARYGIEAPALLRLVLVATTDRPTLMNPAAHPYWTLDGGPTWAGHALRIAADRYLPTDAEDVPTGEIAPVEGTQMDFRESRRPLPGAPPLDHNFCLSEARGPLRDVLWLGGASGLQLIVATTEPGLQVYDGRRPARPGRQAYEGLAVEAQFWPDAPNRPGFPPIELAPGEAWRQETTWRLIRP